MPLSPALLQAAGEALYGSRWQSALAADLGVTYRTMRRWMTGERAMPPRMSDELLRLLSERRLCIDDVSEALSP